MGFEHVRPDPELLARWIAELDVPIDEHEAMIDAVDWVNGEKFRLEIQKNPAVREQWEKFLFASEGSEGDDDEF